MALKVALPNAALAACMKALVVYGPPEARFFGENLVDSNAYKSFTFLISLSVAFHASQAYSRFWTGAGGSFGIIADFFDVASSLVAFTRGSKVEPSVKLEFHHMVVRLISLLHALICADLESEGEISGQESAFSYELIDIEGLDAESLETLQKADRKVELVFQWLQALIKDAQYNGILAAPPPIVTRAFQELNSGMVGFHQALTISEVSFPFPYVAANTMVLIVHWVLTPLVVVAWSHTIFNCAALAFVQVFMVWTLHAIALELERPFGKDDNDLPMEAHHRELNARLILLLDETRSQVPRLASTAALDMSQVAARKSGLKWRCRPSTISSAST